MVGPGQVVDRFPTRRSALLLARVALSRSGRIGRDDLANILWPDDFIDSTRLRLRQELNRLREALGPAAEIISSDRSWVSIDFERATVDVREFSRLIASEEHLAKGLELYAGPLLPGSEEDWAVAERLEWQSKFIHAISERAQTLLAHGEAQEALTLALRAVRSDPSHEGARMIAMRAFAAMGDLGGAIRLFQDFERGLQRDLGVMPSAAIVELAAELRSSSKEPATQAVAPVEIESPTSAPLPVYLDQGVGRENEVALVVGWFTEKSPIRLATITGPGGVGKTRLATEAAKAIIEKTGIRTIFVSLADLESGKKVAPKVVDAFGIFGSGESRDPIPGLGSQKCLIILDNAEHVLEDTRQVSRSILLAHPNAQILATSRQKLGLGGEQELPLAPLKAPGILDGEEGLEDSPAAQLFMLRARSTKPGYTVPPGQGEALAMLLERLDGLPLAIELAAARVGSLTPSQMLDEIDDRFTLLVTRRADVSARQSSLRATIDWSFLALSEDLKKAMGRLAIFRGGWTIALAKDVLDRADAVDVLQDLLDRSLIHQDESGGEGRYGMLEMIRDYVIADMGPEELDECRRRHAEAIAAFQFGASRKQVGLDQQVWYEAARTELNNAHVAIEWAADREGAVASRLGAAMWRYWCARGLPTEAAYYLDRILSCPDQLPTQLWGETYVGRGKIAASLGEDSLASAWYRKAYDTFIVKSADWTYGWAKYLLAHSLFEEGKVQEAWECAEAATEHSNRLTIPFLQFLQSSLHIRLGRVEVGIELAEKAFAMMLAEVEPSTFGWAYTQLGEVYSECARPESAYGLFLEGVERLRQESIRDYLLGAIVKLAKEELRRGMESEASAHLVEARELARELGDVKSEMSILALEAHAAASHEDIQSAMMLYESAIQKGKPETGARVLFTVTRMLAVDLYQLGRSDLARLVLEVEIGLREHTGCPPTPAEQADVEALVEGIGEDFEPTSITSGQELAATALKAIAQARVG